MFKKNQTHQFLKNKEGLWISLGLSIFKHWRLALVIWLALLASGVYIYSQVINKEGFPSLNPPLIVVSGDYFVDDLELIDQTVSQPLQTILSETKNNLYVQTSSFPNGFQALIGFALNTDDQTNLKEVKNLIESHRQKLPDNLSIKVTIPRAVSFLDKYDLLIAVYDADNLNDTYQTQLVAEAVSNRLVKQPYLKEAEVVPLIVKDPISGQKQQISFNDFALADPQTEQPLTFYEAVHIGVVADKQEVDIFTLSQRIKQQLDNLDLSQLKGDFQLKIAEDFVPAIERNLQSLENNLLTGLLVIGFLSLLLISWRASLVIVLFMLSVLSAVIIALYLIGYSLNIITLFALILALGLLVDDAVIMVEALDVYKQKRFSDKKVVQKALKRILLASLAGTLTTALVFLPLAFVEGILGEFIRFIPLTLVIILITSFIFSVTLIPALARLTILKEKKNGFLKKYNRLPQIEQALAHKISQLPLLLKTRPVLGKTIMLVILTTVGCFLFLSFSTAGKLKTDIFPPLKDADELNYEVYLPGDYDLKEAQRVASQIAQIAATELEDYVLQINYLNNFKPTSRFFEASLDLKPLDQRQIFSPKLSQRLQAVFDQKVDPQIKVFVKQSDVGPPRFLYPFNLIVSGDDHQEALALAEIIKAYLKVADLDLKEANGQRVELAEIQISDYASLAIRLNQKPMVNLQISYQPKSVSEDIVRQTKAAIKDYFTPQRLTDLGYAGDNLDNDNLEPSFEESFQSLIYVFPIALLLIYLLLLWQFKSWLQPLMLFVALPFAMAGVLSWLHFSQTSMSFIIGVGFITLIGVAVNNTILLTTYANQARRTLEPIEAISLAIKERFRPLVITTLTTILALLPLALNDFFWQNLALTIIWGLISSTVLVLLTFPYCYLLFCRLTSKSRRSK